MKAPDVEITHRITPEEMRARMKPCVWCGAVEPEVSPGVFLNPRHDYSKHPGMAMRRDERMSTEELQGIPRYDFRDFRDVCSERQPNEQRREE